MRLTPINCDNHVQKMGYSCGRNVAYNLKECHVDFSCFKYNAQLINDQCSHHMETSQLICSAS